MKVHALCVLLLADVGEPDRGIDLLRRVDPAVDALRGAWRFDGPALHMESMSRLQIPWLAPAEFDLVLEVERLAGAGKLLVGLGAFDVVIDNLHANEHRAGMHRLDGRHVTEYPARIGALFRNDTRHRVVYAVRRGSVVVRLDGLEILRFEGDFKRLSLDPRTVPPKRGAFFIANELSPYRIHQASLRPAGGERGTSLSTPDRCPLPFNQARWRCGSCGRVAVAGGPAAPVCHATSMRRT